MSQRIRDVSVSKQSEGSVKVGGRGGGGDDVGREGSSATYSFYSDCTGTGQRLLGGEDSPICWICLDTGSEERPLTQPCKCPRFCHARCLARWQLQSAGTRREILCDFCDTHLPDWRLTLTPEKNVSAPAIMNVNFDCRTYSFEVKPGSSGYRQFTEAIRHAFQLPEDSELNITFTCDEPCSSDNGSLLTLQGPGAYDAAVYCASVSAARRQINQCSLSQNNNSSPLDTDPLGASLPTSSRTIQRAQTIGTIDPAYHNQEYLQNVQQLPLHQSQLSRSMPSRTSPIEVETSEISRKGLVRIFRKFKNMLGRITRK